jgi:hypothetical protein
MTNKHVKTAQDTRSHDEPCQCDEIDTIRARVAELEKALELPPAGQECDVSWMVASYLKAMGFDGMFNSGLKCGCTLEYFQPCGEMCSDCQAGYSQPDTAKSHGFDYYIGPYEYT